MSIAGFTAGPWIVDPAWPHTVTTPDGVHICVTISRRRPAAENAANARLVAAAPVMADTLRRLWALALQQPEFTNFCDEVVVQCRAALATIEVST